MATDDWVIGQLEAAEQQLDSGADADALETLVKVWNHRRVREIADLVDAIEVRLRSDPPRRSQKKWLAVKPTLHTIGELVRDLVPRRSAHFAERMETVSAWPADPRIGSAVERMWREVPFTSNSARQNLRAAFGATERLARNDPRFVGISFDEDWEIRPSQADWMRRRFAEHREAIDEAWPELPTLTSAASEVVARMRSALALDVGPSDQDELERDFLAEIYADPTDLGIRAVYADVLQEAGDPRGEFVALQLAGESGEELLAEHEAEWLGPLADVLDDVRWANGFPVSGILRTNEDRRLLSLQPGALNTLEHLEIRNTSGSDTTREILAGVIPHLRTLYLPWASEMVDVLLETPAPRLEHLPAFTTSLLVRQRLANKPFPALRSVELRGDPSWLEDAVWVDQLETLEGADAAAAWELALTHPRLAIVRSTGNYQLTMSRGEDGTLSILRIGSERTLPVIRSFRDEAFVEVDIAIEHWSEALAERIQAFADRQVRLRRLTTPDGVFEREPSVAAIPEPKQVTPSIERVSGLCASDDGELFLATRGQVVRWTRSEKFSVLVEQDAQAVDAHGDRLAIGYSGLLEIRDTEGQLLVSVPIGESVLAVRWSPDGERLAVGTRSRLVVYDADGQELFDYTSGKSQWEELGWSPTGDRVAGAADCVRVVPVDGGRARLLKPNPPWRPRKVDWGSDERIMAWGAGGLAEFEANTKPPVDTWDARSVRGLAFSPSRRQFAWLVGQELRVRDEEGERTLCSFQNPRYLCWRDETEIAVAEFGALHIVDAESGAFRTYGP